MFLLFHYSCSTRDKIVWLEKTAKVLGHPTAKFHREQKANAKRQLFSGSRPRFTKAAGVPIRSISSCCLSKFNSLQIWYDKTFRVNKTENAPVCQLGPALLHFSFIFGNIWMISGLNSYHEGRLSTYGPQARMMFPRRAKTFPSSIKPGKSRNMRGRCVTRRIQRIQTGISQRNLCLFQ